MTPTHTRKGGRLYRYYVATSVLRSGLPHSDPALRVPAIEIEQAVIEQIKVLARTPEVIAATWRATKQHIAGITEHDVREHLLNFLDLWNELFPAEQARIVRLLVSRIEISSTGADITLKTEGLTILLDELRRSPNKEAA